MHEFKPRKIASVFLNTYEWQMLIVGYFDEYHEHILSSDIITIIIAFHGNVLRRPIEINYKISDWDNKYDEIKKIYSLQCPLLVEHSNPDKGYAWLETAVLARYNDIPLISYIIDTYNRYRIDNAFIDKEEIQDIKPYRFISLVPFYKELYDQDRRGTRIKSLFEELLVGVGEYLHGFRFQPPVPLNLDIDQKFTDNVGDILIYIYAVSQMLNSVIKKEKKGDFDPIMPFQFDLAIIPWIRNVDIKTEIDYMMHSDDKSSSDSDCSEDEATDHEVEDAIPNYPIIEALDTHHVRRVSFKIQKATLQSKHLTQIAARFGQEFKAIKMFHRGRHVMVVNRRETEEDDIYIYSPRLSSKGASKTWYDRIEKHFVNESLIYKTRQCLIPGLDTEKKWNYGHGPHTGARDKNMIILSFHMISKEVLRCYLYIKGGVTRFEAKDLATLLPKYFKSTVISEPKVLDKKWIHTYFGLALQDEEFYNWYETTTRI